MESLSIIGGRLKEEFCKLILEALTRNPEGLTSTELSKLTDIEPKISDNKGFVAWSYLKHLVETKRIRREGKKYFLA